MLGRLIEENDVEQRLVHLDAAVVNDKAELAKAIHEEANGFILVVRYALCTLRDGMISQGCRGVLCDKTAQ
jgi:hypothetical protein